MNSILKRALRPIFKAVAKLPLGNPHHNQEIELMVTKQKPVCIISLPQEIECLKKCPNPARENAINKMKEMIYRGEIILIGEKYFNKIDLIQTFAQVDKIEQGKELFARAFERGLGYPLLEGVNCHIRIGELLGYESYDLNLYKKTGLTGMLLDKTREWRRKIRKEINLE